MFGKSFWQGVLRDGAVLGLVMAASHLFESFMLYGNMALGKVSLIITIEMLAAAIFFVWYLFFAFFCGIMFGTERMATVKR